MDLQKSCIQTPISSANTRKMLDYVGGSWGHKENVRVKHIAPNHRFLTSQNIPSSQLNTTPPSSPTTLEHLGQKEQPLPSKQVYQ